MQSLKVYTKATCGYCDAVKSYLQTQAVQFEEIDIEDDSDAKAFIISEGHRTVPQIYTEGNELFVFGGYTGLMELGRQALLEKLQ